LQKGKTAKNPHHSHQGIQSNLVMVRQMLKTVLKILTREAFKTNDR